MSLETNFNTFTNRADPDQATLVMSTLLAYYGNVKILFCFTFVSDHNTGSLMLYSVQLKNMYSYPNSFLKMSDIVWSLLSTIILLLDTVP